MKIARMGSGNPFLPFDTIKFDEEFWAKKIISSGFRSGVMYSRNRFKKKIPLI